MKTTLTFDPVEHAYHIDGVRVPSVTQLLRPLGGYDYVQREAMERKSLIGRAVHLACHLDDAGDLDEATVSPDIAPYLEAWRRFRREVPCSWVMSETPVYHRSLAVAGTPDRVGLVRDLMSVVDIKCVAKVMPATGVQLEAYRTMINIAGGSAPELPYVQGRIAVQLMPDGTYRMHTFTDAMDYQCLMAIRTIHEWSQSK